MEQYVGLDVSQEQTSVCVVDGGGKVIWEGKCTSTPEAIAATLRTRAPEAVRIGLESGPLSAWHWHELRKLGLPVVCLDARHAKAALALQLNKSDRNDARGLAQIVRTGWYREVAVKSVDSHLVRSLLTTRAQLVRMRVDLANQIRGTLKPFGLIAGKGGGRPFAERVRALVAGGPLQEVAGALLAAWQAIGEQIAVLSRRLVAVARQDEAVRRLMTAPGVGVLVALASVSVVDAPERFTKSSSVGAYIGLTPRRYQSGEEDYTGHNLPLRRQAAAHLPVRGGRDHPPSCPALVGAKGLGDAPGKADRHQEGHRRRGPQALGHPPSHAARRQRVSLVDKGGPRGMSIG
jgi:transposase